MPPGTAKTRRRAAKPRPAGAGTAEPGPAGGGLATGGPAAPQTVPAADSPAPPKSAPEFRRSITMETAFQPLADGRHYQSRVIDGVLTFVLVRGDEESSSERFARLAKQREEEAQKRKEAELAERQQQQLRLEEEARIAVQHEAQAQALAAAIASETVRFVVERMREHPTNATIQQQACARLLNLTPSVGDAAFQRILSEDGEAWKEMDRKYRELASAGVIDVVCQAISTQPAEVAATGCRILRFLARSRDNQAQIAGLGGIEALVTVMKEHWHPAHAGVQEEACATLRNLTVNADNRGKIAAQWGIEALLKAMDEHPAHAGVQEQACWALRNLAANADIQVNIAALGGIEALLKAMEEHPAHAGVQEQACAALLNIGTSNRDRQQRIKRAGAAEQVGRAMAASNATDDTKKWGQMLLDRLANT